MSDIQNDRVENRSYTLESGDVSKREQIPDKLLSKLKKKDFGKIVTDMWHKGNANRTVFLQRQEEFLNDYDEFLESTSDGPFNGASTLHIPMPFIVIKTFHARMLQALLADDFQHQVKARHEGSVDNEQAVADTIRYYLKDHANEYEGVYDALDSWVWNWCASGTGQMKWSWQEKYTRFMDVEEQGDFDVVEGPDGQNVAIPITKEVEVVKTEQTYSGPILETRDVEDLLIVGGEGNTNKADAVIDRQWVTASDLRTWGDRKVFNSKAVEKAIDAGGSSVSGSVNGQIKSEKALNAGKSDPDVTEGHDRYEILECYMFADIDGSGINSDIVIWVDVKTMEILRATYLRRISPSGKRPFVKADFFKRKGQEYGMGLAEILHPISVEMDFLHNHRIDTGMITAMPFGFYRATSGIEPKEIDFKPGVMIPVESPQTDVVFPNFGPKTVFGAQEEAALDVLVQRMTGISDLTLGVVSSRQGASRTARGVSAIQGEAASNIDVHLRRLTHAWRQGVKYLHDILQKRIPVGLSFRVSGQDSNDYFHTVRSREEIAGDYDFEIASNSASSNPQVRLQKAQEVLTQVMDPLAIQLGIISPRNVFEAKKNLFRALDVKETSRFITEPRQIPHILSPHEEFLRVVNGINVPVEMGADHEGYLKYFESITSGDELGMYSQDQVMRAAAQAQAHQQMIEAMSQLQAQASNRQQIQTNASLGQEPQQA